MKTYVQERYGTFKTKPLAKDLLRPLYSILPQMVKQGLKSLETTNGKKATISFPYFQYLGQGESKVLFDVGAFTGEHTLFMESYFPSAQVYSFEPNAVAFEQLKIFVPPNDKHILQRLALTDQVGKGYLYEFGHPKANSFLDLISEEVTQEVLRQGSHEVETTTVDQFCEVHSIPQVDLLHIDVNGTETKVLQGSSTMLKKQKICYINVIHRFDSPYINSSLFPELDQFLFEHGYRLVDLHPLYRKNDGLEKAQIIYAPQPS